MNKVRIYDLSKELNLENKDLLVICQKLNIAVKSHSSSISEEEAVQIRDEAEKFFANNPRPSTSTSQGEKGERRDRSAPRSAEPKQPQIINIKPKSPGEAGLVRQPLAPQAPTTNKLEKPTTSVPMQPTTPNRPVPRTIESSPSEAIKTPKQLPSPQPPQQNRPQLVVPPSRSDSKGNEEEGERPRADRSERPAPPVKPQQPGRPVPKSQQQPQSKGERSGQPGGNGNRPQRGEGHNGNGGGNRRPAGKGERESLPPLNRPQPRIVQIKPQGGVGVGNGGLDLNDKDEAGTPELETIELKRPTPPRQPVKKAKGWGGKEEEEETEAAKAKVPAKNKRKAVIIDDDDDDDDGDDDLMSETATMVLGAIARPPKPKHLVKVTTAAATPTRRKPVRSGDRQQQDRNKREQKPTAEKPELITLTGSATVRDLAEMLGVAETEIVKQLFFKGIAISVTQILDLETATMVAEEMGVLVDTQEEQAAATKITEMLDLDDLDSLQRRPPVVTIMGHVDHGKTTLLDAIRETKVAQGEAGGITQHIGAYHVDVDYNGQTQQVVFLDTPGHEAFTAMRARGARVTDIAVLVVAADDGVRPQTIEAIRHAQAAEVPIVVAINKMDKPSAQPDRVQQELTEYGLLSEEWGGQTVMVPVSALKGDNLDRLLENLLIVAELEDLHANPDRLARGTVIEAHLDKAKGPVATLLIQNGTLKKGDTLVAGHVFGKVKAMVDDRLERVDAAGPSFAVEVLGLSDVPAAGDEFEVYPEREARALSDTRTADRRQSRLQEMLGSRRVTLGSISDKAKEGELKELNLILKADVQGSVEAILGMLKELPQNEVQVRVLLSAAGEITETDVDLAAASGAIIIGFNTSLAPGARSASDDTGVEVREYDVIYKLFDEIKDAMEGLLEPEMVEEPLGQVEVRAVFQAGRGNIAGCYVLSGKAIRNCHIRVRRKGSEEVVYEGNLDSLKRVKDDVKEVNSGFECGVRLDRFNDWKDGDIIETFQMVSKRRTLSPA
jgi:translation initiation factor IF-2